MKAASVEPPCPDVARIEVRAISPSETHALRRAVLRPARPREALAFPGDSGPETFHLGAFIRGELLGIASLYREPPPGQPDPDSWRLRGMATRRDARRRGVGSALVGAALERIEARGARRVWCNARVEAASFYRGLGFAERGTVFEIPGIGPHVFMWRPVGD